MIVHRHLWKVKHGCRDEFIESTKAMLDEAGVAYRICSFIFGPYDTVIVDTEFETEEDRQRFSWDWNKPIMAKWHERHYDLVESGVVNELLRVH